MYLAGNDAQGRGMPHVRYLRGLEVVLEDVDGGGRIITPVLDNDAAGANDLASVALLVDFAQARPLAELLAVLNLKRAGGGEAKSRSEKRSETRASLNAAKISALRNLLRQL
jgi:hypothetical protein